MPEFKPPSPGRDRAAWDPCNMLATSHVPSLGLSLFICKVGIMKIAVWSECGREKVVAVRGACSLLWLLQQKHMHEQPLAHTTQPFLQELNNLGYSLAVVHVCEISRFSHVWLYVILWTVDRQAPLSMGFSRPEYWSGFPCPSPEDLLNPGNRTCISYVSCIDRRVLYH